MWLLNKKLVNSKVAYKLFPGTRLKDFSDYIKPTLHENEIDTSVLHMAVNDALKLRSNTDSVKRYCKYWEPYCISCDTNHYFWFDTFYALKCKFYAQS